MEEEGDVVYFQSSPEVNVFREADIDITENIFHEEQPTTVQRREATAGTVSGVTAQWMRTLKLFILGNKQEKVKTQLFNMIKRSSLLTEDDYQYLSMSLDPSQSGSTSHDGIVSTVKPSIMGVLVVLVVVLLTLFPLPTMCLLAGGITLKPYLPSSIFSRQSRSCDSHMTDYLSNCDKFLLLLTKSMRCIQERELAHNGFDRPSVGVPMNRLESHIQRYQCRILRVRVFSLCQKGIWLTKDHVCSFVNNYPLNLEMDDIHDYVSFRELSDLHEYLDTHHYDNSYHRDDGYQSNQTSEEHDDKPPHLSLHSLRTAASLFAIFNSELLRRIALLVDVIQSPVDAPDEEMLLNDIAEVTKSLNEFVISGIESLQWSINYYNIPSTPETTPTLSISSEDSPLSFIELELHSSDLQTLTALNKIRELNINDTDELEGEIVAVVNHLNTAEKHLRSVLDHLKNSKKSLNNQSSSTDPSSTDEHTLMAGNAPLLPPDTISSDEDSEDDEKIYEAMVTEEERLASLDHCLTEETEVSKTQKEASLKMLNELNSVLAVRKVEKQKKAARNDKKQRAKKEVKEEKIDSDTHCVTLENSCTVSTSTSLKDITPTDVQLTEESAVNKVPMIDEVRRTESHTRGMGWRLVENESEGDNPLITTTREGHMNLIALVAASRAKVKKEEVFIEDIED